MDGSAAFFKGINDRLKKLGPDYTAAVVGSAGYSRGEDKFMGPPAWKEDPQKARGGLVAGYLRDGDWNIALKWLGDNRIPNNPDETRYDPEALNWVAAADYIDAAQKYVAGHCTDLKNVKTGAVVERTLHQANIAFFFAPTFHPSMRHAAQTRKDLGIRTAFNLLGPLSNPAGAKRQLIGVFAKGKAARKIMRKRIAAIDGWNRGVRLKDIPRWEKAARRFSKVRFGLSHEFHPWQLRAVGRLTGPINIYRLLPGPV